MPIMSILHLQKLNINIQKRLKELSMCVIHYTLKTDYFLQLSLLYPLSLFKNQPIMGLIKYKMADYYKHS